ncbi:MAG: hypothetical protein AAF682_24230 [Planctomycetota bacterium]
MRSVTKALLAALLCASCGGEGGHSHDHDSHAEAGGHVHHAPHGGLLVVLGDEMAHVELLHEPDANSLTAWLLDGEAEKALRSAQSGLTVVLEGEDGELELVLEPQASTLTGETVGDTSEFRGVDEGLARPRELAGHIERVEVLGSTFENVTIEAEHDHDH